MTATHRHPDPRNAGTVRPCMQEEAWLNSYDTLTEARAALDAYLAHYNVERPHSALDCQTPSKMAVRLTTHLAAQEPACFRGNGTHGNVAREPARGFERTRHVSSGMALDNNRQ